MDTNSVHASVGNETYTTRLTARTHTLLADEPEKVGGKNLGPQPGEYLRMALASCTAITLRMYANRKKWDVEKIDVHVLSEMVEGKTVFNTDIKITGTINDEQRDRLLQIAKLCPTHKTLTNPIEIKTKLQ